MTFEKEKEPEQMKSEGKEIRQSEGMVSAYSINKSHEDLDEESRKFSARPLIGEPSKGMKRSLNPATQPMSK